MLKHFYSTKGEIRTHKPLFLRQRGIPIPFTLVYGAGGENRTLIL